MVYIDKGKDKDPDSPSNFVNKTIGNIKLEITNVYLMFENKTFNFSAGLLIPKIQVDSLDELWNKIDRVVDPSVILKKVTVSDISAFVNRNKFKSIEHTINLWETQSEQDIKNKN